MPIHHLIKTRFSPSPTGHMHLGNVRTALFSYLAAHHEKGHFLLRIEDTDKLRSRAEYVDCLKHDLQWLGLMWDEGPFFQSDRHDLYDTYYQLLEKNNSVYPCFCSDEQLALARKIQLSSGSPPRYSGTCRHLTSEQIHHRKLQGLKPTLRFKVPIDKEIVFEDLIKGRQSFKSEDIGDFIIRRADQSASFFFCNAIDDALMGVTHTIRGEDHLTNTPRQLLILEALSLEPPHYGHLPLILSQDGDKLSKREGSQNLESLREEGYLPLAIMNYLARLGHYYEQTELLTLPELIQHFSLSHIGKTPAHFDNAHLLHWQKQAVMQLNHTECWNWIQPALEKELCEKIFPSEQESLTSLIKSNFLFPSEAIEWMNILYCNIPFNESAKNILQNIDNIFFKKFSEIISAQENDLGKNYSEIISALSQTTGLKGKALFQPLRMVLTGQLHGPELPAIFNLLGKKRLLEKIQHAEKFIRH